VRLLVDCHLPRLLSARAQPASLAALAALAAQQAGQCGQLLALLGAAEHVRAGAPLPAAHAAAASQYVVQLIDLGIAAGR
jgi:hypothetical protein